MDLFVLDTSVFTNPDVYTQFEKDQKGAVESFLSLASRSTVRFYMPTSVYEELNKMVELGSLRPKFETLVRVRSPRRYSLTVPAEFLYDFVEELRHRINKGLRIAEEHTKEAGKLPEEVGKLVGRLREKYREALRTGIIDSKEDLDALLLAYELDGVLVSGDEGLRSWADKVGVKLIDPRSLKAIMENCTTV